MVKNKTQKRLKSLKTSSYNKTRKVQSCHTCQPAFTQEDYDSNNGMMTSIWGPAAWHFIHSISFNYPVHPTPEQKKEYMNFILSLRYILPCGKCRKNLAKNFKKLPLTMKQMESRATFSKYVYNLHKVINTMLNKKTNVTYEEVRDIYEHFRARCMDANKTQKTGQEKGCVIPYYGKKQKCILSIVPQTNKCKTFRILKK